MCAVCIAGFIVTLLFFFFFKQKTAYEMRISDWSSDVCSSDLAMSKMFGVTRAQRTVSFSDFHLAPGEDPESRDSKELYIEALIAFPELLDGSATPEIIAQIGRASCRERVCQYV